MYIPRDKGLRNAKQSPGVRINALQAPGDDKSLLLVMPHRPAPSRGVRRATGKTPGRRRQAG